MALTWATGVRFGRATRRNERENELHLAANRLWVIVRAKKHLFPLLICIFMFFGLFWAFRFRPCVWPVMFFRPISNFGFYLYVP
ncbi:hypothetical protein Hanom_Chr15g01344281 [Helianthus anomalus]